MSTIVSGYQGDQNVVLLKGAPERVVERCIGVSLADGGI